MRRIVFVGYSNKDKVFLEELLSQLESQFGKDKIDRWDEHRISKKDKKWKKLLRQALGEAFAAVILISPDYLKTKYNRKFDISSLLEEAENEGLVVRLVIVSESALDLFNLAQFKAINDGAEDLYSLGVTNRNSIWEELIEELKEAEAFDPNDKPEIGGMIHAIKSQYPEISDEEAEDVYLMVLKEVAKHIGAGDQLASAKEGEEIDATPIEIKKLK